MAAPVRPWVLSWRAQVWRTGGDVRFGRDTGDRWRSTRAALPTPAIPEGTELLGDLHHRRQTAFAFVEGKQEGDVGLAEAGGEGGGDAAGDDAAAGHELQQLAGDNAAGSRGGYQTKCAGAVPNSRF